VLRQRHRIKQGQEDIFFVSKLVEAADGALVKIPTSLAIAALADWPVIISLENLMIAMAFAAGLSCFFGFYPARKASRMDPVDALRCE
jgi:ABC-type antimicrobial peptide transport system permease subunit